MTTLAGNPFALDWIHAGEPSALTWVTSAEPVQTMLTPEGLRVWVGEGAPHVVVGASAGDLYLDSISGMLYRLD